MGDKLRRAGASVGSRLGANHSEFRVLCLPLGLPWPFPEVPKIDTGALLGKRSGLRTLTRS